jgi:hypothetical protein
MTAGRRVVVEMTEEEARAVASDLDSRMAAGPTPPWVEALHRELWAVLEDIAEVPAVWTEGLSALEQRALDGDR